MTIAELFKDNRPLALSVLRGRPLLPDNDLQRSSHLHLTFETQSDFRSEEQPIIY